MITVPDVPPDVGLVVAGTVGPAGGDGSTPAGGLSDAVSDAAAPLGVEAWRDPAWRDPAWRDLDDDQSLISAAVLAPTPPTGWSTDRSITAEMAFLLGGGVGFIVISAFLRRRHRRRVGWGVLPERSLFWRDFCG